MGENPDLADSFPSSSLWDPEVDAGASKSSPATRPMARLFSLAILGYLAACAAGFVSVSRVFGLGSAMVLSLVPVFPLIVAVRMRRRWPGR